MKTIGVGLIGWGFMGRTHTEALRNIALFYPDADFRVSLEHVCSRRIEKRAKRRKSAAISAIPTITAFCSPIRRSTSFPSARRTRSTRKWQSPR